MLIRSRVDADRPACAALLELTYTRDGYPRYRHDWDEFLSPPSETAAWVAELDGEVVGHVSVHESGHEVISAVAAEATGRPPTEFAVLARLMISPQARGHGLAARLIELVADHAAERGRHLILDVLRDATGAIAVYERLGWRRLGPAIRPTPGRPDIDLWVYLAPEPAVTTGTPPISISGAVLITGTVGAGKTATAGRVGELLGRADTSYAVIDLDEIRRFGPMPPGDPFGVEVELANLTALASVYRRNGIERLVVAGVCETWARRQLIHAAVGIPLTVCRLRSAQQVVISRLARRHAADPDVQAWHVARAAVLEEILDATQVADVEVAVDGHTVDEVAGQVLEATAWLSLGDSTDRRPKSASSRPQAAAVTVDP